MKSNADHFRRPSIDLVDPRKTPFTPLQYRGELPYLYKEGGSYFVTFRLWDAVVPAEQRQLWQNLQRQLDQPSRRHNRDAAIELATASEPPLQIGSCLLGRHDVALIVQNALLYFHAVRYQLAAWCVMPNHVHVAYTALKMHTPEDIHHSWKSYTSHEINKLLGRRGTLWERESFDHLIRSIEHYQAYIEYIESNPVAAGLCATPADWPRSSAAFYATR
jgi:putative transposase